MTYSYIKGERGLENYDFSSSCQFTTNAFPLHAWKKHYLDEQINRHISNFQVFCDKGSDFLN